ncbi:MAG TPA: hypothetical protein QF753_14275 [Victivallales bacterium]|nr:hypothetical protein [Victivallales bacterium]
MQLIKQENWIRPYYITEKEHVLNVDVNASLKYDNDFGYYIDLCWDYLISIKSISGNKERLIDPKNLNKQTFEKLEEMIKEDLYRYWM